MFDVLADFIGQFFFDAILGSLKHIGAFAKSLFKKKPYKEILKENWNTRLGIIILAVLIRFIILLIDKL